MFEYYLGEKLLKNGDEYALSIIQYSDTGFFETEADNYTDINSFAAEEASVSKLLFILEVKPKKAKNWIWNVEELCMSKEYASLSHTQSLLEVKKGHKQVLYSFPLDQFLNEKTSLKALKEFIHYCKENDVVDLDLI